MLIWQKERKTDYLQAPLQTLGEPLMLILQAPLQTLGEQKERKTWLFVGTAFPLQTWYCNRCLLERAPQDEVFIKVCIENCDEKFKWDRSRIYLFYPVRRTLREVKVKVSIENDYIYLCPALWIVWRGIYLRDNFRGYLVIHCICRMVCCEI